MSATKQQMEPGEVRRILAEVAPHDLTEVAQEAVRSLLAATDQVLRDWRDRKLTTREPLLQDMRVGRDLANSLNQLAAVLNDTPEGP